MYSVGLDVDTLVSIKKKIRLYAENSKNIDPLNIMMLLGTIQYKEKSAGYGDKPLKISDHIENKKPISETELGNYLAGLIEGHGSISEEKIEIRLHELDVSLAYYIKKRIGYGKVIKKSNAVIYELKHLEGLKKVLELINGKLRLGNSGDKKSNILNNH
jgi:hypothetical protein